MFSKNAKNKNILKINSPNSSKFEVKKLKIVIILIVTTHTLTICCTWSLKKGIILKMYGFLEIISHTFEYIEINQENLWKKIIWEK